MEHVSPQPNQKLEYISPAEQDPENQPQHKFNLTKDGEIIGGAEIDYFSKPLPIYQLTDLWVESEYAGQGNASQIMEQVEVFLKERRKPGILTDAIMDDNPAQGMYERRGWIPVPDSHGLHVYNWPEDVPLEILKGYEMRSAPMEDREDYQDYPDDFDDDTMKS